MNKMVIAASLMAAFGAANADVSFSGGSGQALVNFGIGNLIPGVVPQDFGIVGGTLESAEASTLYLTYLGKEASDLNTFFFEGNPIFVNSETPPKIYAGNEVAGTLDFKFSGDNTAPTAIFAVLGKMDGETFMPYTGQGTGFTFDFVIGLNDNGSSDGDFDDLVVGISVNNPIPEPSTYALMAAGLGAIGLVARRRQRKA